MTEKQYIIYVYKMISVKDLANVIKSIGKKKI